MSEDPLLAGPSGMVDWSADEVALWRRIAAHSFESSEHRLTFVARLARDHGWSLPHARKAVDEYRRFCFLAVTGGGEVTPSEEVDEVWHQHLTFSRDYWEVWCGEVLRQPLHHQPTKGGPKEGRRFAAQYAETLACYEMRFGTPDPAFWPGTAERFRGGRFMIVDLDATLTIPVPRPVGSRLRRWARLLGAIAAAVAFLPAERAHANLGPLDWQGGDFLQLYAALGLAALVLSMAYRFAMRRGRSGRAYEGRRLVPVEVALLASGPQRASDVIALELMREGRIGISADTIAVVDGPRSSGSGDADLLRQHGTGFTRARMAEILEPSVKARWQRLAEDGLALGPEDVRSIRAVTLALFGAVVAFGLAKVAIGLSRDKPVGLLLLMMAITVVAGFVVASAGRLATRAGARALADIRRDNERALRAPREAEVAMAFAVLGAAALLGTSFATYANVIPKSDGGSGSGCGGGSDSGGDGGGGCGGCGGGGGGD